MEVHKDRIGLVDGRCCSQSFPRRYQSPISVLRGASSSNAAGVARSSSWHGWVASSFPSSRCLAMVGSGGVCVVFGGSSVGSPPLRTKLALVGLGGFRYHQECVCVFVHA